MSTKQKRETKQVRIGVDSYTVLKAKAKEEKMTLSKWLDQLFRIHFGQKEIKKINREYYTNLKISL